MQDRVLALGDSDVADASDMATSHTNAANALAAAQQQADVHIASLHDLDELQDAREVCDVVWPESNGGTQLQPNLLRALVHAGGYASAAYRDGRPIGAAIAFLGRHREPDGSWQVHLHSHMAAVLPEARDQGIGVAVKFHQRLWALDQGIPSIVWTFDPLVRRNARLNLIKLGAQARGYEVNFYGEMPDALNAGDESDRMFAWWEVASRQANLAGAGLLTTVDPDLLPNAIVIDLPDDIVALRAHDPAAARAWRLNVRSGICRALDQGLTIHGVAPSGGYVLSPPSHTPSGAHTRPEV